jgi:hypothetical protein
VQRSLVQKLGLERAALIGTTVSEVVLDMKGAHSSVVSLIRSWYRYITVEVALAGAVAHDFNNVLNVIDLCSSQLLERMENADKAMSDG